MLITDIRTTVLLERALWSRPEAHSTRIADSDGTREVGSGYTPHMPGSVLIEIETDEGLVGLGTGDSTIDLCRGTSTYRRLPDGQGHPGIRPTPHRGQVIKISL